MAAFFTENLILLGAALLFLYLAVTGFRRQRQAKLAESLAGAEGGTVTRVPCPTCKELVHPEATLCPFCKQAIFSHDSGKNAMVAVVSVVVVFALIYFAVTSWVEYRMQDAREKIDRAMEQFKR